MRDDVDGANRVDLSISFFSPPESSDAREEPAVEGQIRCGDRARSFTGWLDLVAALEAELHAVERRRHEEGGLTVDRT